ncbi:hypothetical protein CLIB1423_09S04940 [[Candida] railenensis]|uniref:DNA 3'-5' helicase n=1 Tax=[Candida] railenensis TaxID=45579 RepID=A0A9P0VZ37_9ASCO|nr:hypothetical protein CLIB1423_09S04940 [[Candida] railenensis]
MASTLDPIDLGGLTVDADADAAALPENLEPSQDDQKYEEISIRTTQAQYDAIVAEPLSNTLLSIRAGPGSGKTHTLVNRIGYLISHHKVQPSEILVLSMANRSVKSLRTSLVSTVGEELASRVQLSTFHSFCGNVIEHYGQQDKNAPPKRVMDETSWRAFSTIFSRKSIKINGVSLDSDISAVDLQRMISSIKQGSLSIDAAHFRYKVGKEYIQALLSYIDSNGLMMYSDLITNFLSIVKNSTGKEEDIIPILLNFKVVIVDEFQDMYPELIKVVQSIVNYEGQDKIGSQKHLTIAGDPNQSIYEFLGSNPNLMSNLKRSLPHYEVTEILLPENFRSTPEIINAATEISLKHLEQQGSSTDFQVLAQNAVVRPPSYKPIITSHTSSEEEYLFIAKEITRLICQSGGLLSPSDFVVLSRTNRELDQIEKLLRESYEFKCNKLSSTVLWTYSRVLLFINILLVIQKKGKLPYQKGEANFPLLCILQILDPRSGRRISTLFNSVETNQSIEDYILEGNEDLLKIYKRNPEQLEKVKYFLKLVKEARVKLDPFTYAESEENYTPYITPENLLEILLDICKKCNLLPYLNQQDNLHLYLESFNRSLMHSYSTFTERSRSTDESFLDHFIRNYGDQIPITDKDMINLSTIHAAKGLEFPVVFVTGAAKIFNYKVAPTYWEQLLSEEEIPGIANSKNYEKARLFYVASTRAKHLLYIGSLLKRNDETALPMRLRGHVTFELPEVLDLQNNSSISLLERLSEDLDRDLPSEEKLVWGNEVFQKFEAESRKKGVDSKRYIHTTSVPIQEYEPLKKFEAASRKKEVDQKRYIHTKSVMQRYEQWKKFEAAYARKWEIQSRYIHTSSVVQRYESFNRVEIESRMKWRTQNRYNHTSSPSTRSCMEAIHTSSIERRNNLSGAKFFASALSKLLKLTRR